jgi:hypothetical protein
MGLTVTRSRPSMRFLLSRMLERTMSFSASLNALATLAACVPSSSSGTSAATT